MRSGEADLGWVGVRAFAQAGTTAFEPLITPLLIRSYAAEQTVIESDVANGVLAQLEPLGLVGLGLMPGGLRFPMSTGVPLTTPADWVGQPVYTFDRRSRCAAVAALGADPQHVGFDQRDQGLDDGSIIGLDNTVRFQTDRLDVFTHLVADVPLWTRMSALVAASTTEFTVEEQRWIAEAVADTAGRTAELGEVDREAAERGVHGRRSRLRVGWTRRNRRIRGRTRTRCGGGRQRSRRRSHARSAARACSRHPRRDAGDL